ncbi:MAG: hypothetical protein ACLQFR_27530 [Streptosporangiaceae bacterium]
MESSTRDEIGAAAHAELGRDYDSAVAEGLIERIGAEIDKRVDARVGRVPVGRLARSRRPGTFASLVLALGSMGLGVGGTAVVLSEAPQNTSAASVMVLVIWIAIAAVNWTFMNRRD